MAVVIPTSPDDRSLNLLIAKSNNGDPQSMLTLGLKFALGTGGVSYNEDKAVFLITSAAKLGYDPAKQWIRDNSLARVRIALLCEKKIKENNKTKLRSVKPGHKSKTNNKQTNKSASVNTRSRISKSNGVKKQASKATSPKQIQKVVQHPRRDKIPSPSHRLVSTYEEAIHLLSCDSSESHREGMSLMGKAVYSGDSDALKWLNDKAEGGDNDALFFLGKAYFLGLGVAVSKEKAISYLESIYPLTSSAKYYLGLASLSDDFPHAVKHICSAAHEGHLDAIRWVRQNMDNPRIFSQLISCYIDGFHDPILERKISETALDGNLKAVKAITIDALNGSKNALCTAGKLYEYGIGVEKSIDRAYDLYSRSATPEAYYRAAEILISKGDESYPRIVNMYYLAAVRGYRDARSRLLLFSKRGNPTATYYIGMLYDKDKDFTNALGMMEKAASMGSELAQQWLNEQKESIQSDSENYVGPYGDVSW